MEDKCDLDDVIAALNPLVTTTWCRLQASMDRANYIVVYATQGDFCVACVSNDAKCYGTIHVVF